MHQRMPAKKADKFSRPGRRWSYSSFFGRRLLRPARELRCFQRSVTDWKCLKYIDPFHGKPAGILHRCFHFQDHSWSEIDQVFAQHSHLGYLCCNVKVTIENSFAKAGIAKMAKTRYLFGLRRFQMPEEIAHKGSRQHDFEGSGC